MRKKRSHCVVRTFRTKLLRHFVLPWTRIMGVFLFCYFIYIYFFHLVSTQTHWKLLISSWCFFSKCIFDFVLQRTWMRSFFLFCCGVVIIKSRLSRKKWSSCTLSSISTKVFFEVIGYMLIKTFLNWKSTALTKWVLLFRNWIIYACM